MGPADERIRHAPSSYRFTGREKNSGTSLYYYRARTYDPDTGQFTGKDPSGMVDGPNLYAYAGGNPVNRVDPSGRHFEGCSGWECRAGHDHPVGGSAPPGSGVGQLVGGGGSVGGGSGISGCDLLRTYIFLTVAGTILATVVGLAVAGNLLTWEALLTMGIVQGAQQWMPMLGAALVANDWGTAFVMVARLIIAILSVYIAYAGWLAALGLLGTIASPWLVVPGILFGIGATVYLFWQFSQNNCRWV